MFNLFKKKPAGTKITLKLSGLHCTSCALNIDSELEDLPGIISTTTSYARQESTVIYDPQMASPANFNQIIEKLGYKVI